MNKSSEEGFGLGCAERECLGMAHEKEPHFLSGTPWSWGVSLPQL